MSNIINFNDYIKPEEDDWIIWVCNCGAKTFFLTLEGDVVCTNCNGYHDSVTVILPDTD
jgi:hypothetical protein